MKTFHLLLMSAALLVISSCQSIRDHKVAEDFTNTSRGYLNMVRWHELEKAPLSFIDDSLREEFKKRIEASREVKIFDYRVRNLECDVQKGEAGLTVDWDYYNPPSVKVQSVEDVQKWRYVGEDDKGLWMLMTLLPEFK
ncbi:MAG TPA: hypothetical protein VHN12_12030 [Geobacteraceae bacterium]|nr:hypothetical protein [Geobacteraceae bacterium]